MTHLFRTPSKPVSFCQSLWTSRRTQLRIYCSRFRRLASQQMKVSLLGSSTPNRSPRSTLSWQWCLCSSTLSSRQPRKTTSTHHLRPTARCLRWDKWRKRVSSSLDSSQISLSSSSMSKTPWNSCHSLPLIWSRVQIYLCTAKGLYSAATLGSATSPAIWLHWGLGPERRAFLSTTLPACWSTKGWSFSTF